MKRAPGFFRAAAMAAVLISAGLAGPLAAQTTKSVAKDIGVSELQLKQIMDIRAMSLEAVSKLPKEKIPGLLRRIEHPNLPKERYDARALSYRDPRGGDSNVAGLLSSMKHMKALQSRAPKGLVAGVPTGPEAEAKELVPLAKSITETNWVWLGPGNVGGRTRTLVFHPQNPNLIFAGSVSGGVWRSTDGGANWFPSSALLSNLCVTSLVFDPSDNNVMYAATGEGFIGNLGMRGGGIFKSTDAGQTWSHLPSTDHQSFLQVSRLAISPAGNVLLAATEQGIRRSVDKGQSWSSPMLWERIADVKYHPTDNRKAIAAGQNNGNIWFTEDGGLNWTMSTFWQAKGGRVELTYAKANPNRIYASMDLNSGTLYRSDDGGKVFYQMNGQIQHLGKQGFYDNAIWAGHPTNADLLIVGGLNLHRSVDGGASFQQISIWNNSKSVHADQHFIVEHPKFGTPFDPNEKTVYFCNDGGIFRTQDVYNVGSDWFAQPPYGAGWQEVNWNYGVVQFGGLAVTPSGKVIAGAQDNGNLIYTPAQGPYAWAKPAGAGGDGAFCAADPTNESYLYCEYVRLSLSRTGNGGQSFELIDGSRWVFLNGKWEQFWKNAPYVLGDARDRKALFYAPFVMDPQNPQRLFAGGQSLWRTDDARAQVTDTTGPQWKSIKPPYLVNGVPQDIAAIVVDPKASGVVYVGHIDGAVFKSTNATQPFPTWTRVGVDSNLPVRFCHNIFVDPNNSNTVYAGFGMYSTQNIWKSVNGGATWFDASAGLPALPIRAVTVHPRNSNWVYIGTDVGVFQSTDGAATWWPTNKGPVNVSVEQFAWQGDNLYVATYGRGVYAITIPVN